MRKQTHKIFKQDIPNNISGFVPGIFIMLFTVLELGIAFIQAQVFTVLSSSYVKDSLVLH